MPHATAMRFTKKIRGWYGASSRWSGWKNRTLHAVRRALEREGEKSPDGKP
jgi:hypothetical protein